VLEVESALDFRALHYERQLGNSRSIVTLYILRLKYLSKGWKSPGHLHLFIRIVYSLIWLRVRAAVRGVTRLFARAIISCWHVMLP